MRFRFVLSEILGGLRRNFSIVVSVVLVTFVSLTFVGSGMLLQRAITNLKGSWYDQVEVSVMLCPQSNRPTASCPDGEVTTDQKTAIEDKLKSAELEPYIEKYMFETKEMAFEEFKKSAISNQSIGKNVTVDMMQESYRIKLKDPQQYQVVEELLSGMPGVNQILDFHTLLGPLFTLLNQLTAIAWGVAIVMLVAAVLLITTTIRLSALNRRRETGIQRLVGASNFFIQLPFMLEGAIAAALGALLAIGVLVLGVGYLSNGESSAKAVTNGIGSSDVLIVAPILLVLAIVLALISSAFALRRYLKV